jgi:hypothetical protein
MIRDQRKFRRRQVRCTAWIGLPGGALHGCVLTDISDSGARLDVEDSRKIPDRFPLYLTNKGAPRRNCRVIWRKPTAVGVDFDRVTRETFRPAVVPALAASQVAASNFARGRKHKNV